MPLPINELPAIKPCTYASARQHIKSGDILLASGTSVFSQLIQHATNSIWSHVGFILRLDEINRIMVLESVETIGVRTVPLSSYLSNYNGTEKGYPGDLVVARHDDFDEKNINNLSQFAVDLFGYPYASEDIVKIAARIGMDAFGFHKDHPLVTSNKAFICSEYVYECYKSIGLSISYNTEGYIAPADFARCLQINTVCKLQA